MTNAGTASPHVLSRVPSSPDPPACGRTEPSSAYRRGARSGPTKAMTWRALSTRFGSSMGPRTSRKRPATEPPTVGQLTIRLRSQPAATEVARAGFSVAEDGRRLAKTATPWSAAGRLDRHVCRGIQLGTIADLGGDVSFIVRAEGGGPSPLGAHWQEGASQRRPATSFHGPGIVHCAQFFSSLLDYVYLIDDEVQHGQQPP